MAHDSRRWILIILVFVVMIFMAVFTFEGKINKKITQLQQSMLQQLTVPSNEKFYIKDTPKRADCVFNSKKAILEESNFQAMVDSKRGSEDTEVIALLQRIIDTPSENMLKRSNNLLTTPQAKAVKKILGNKKNGFFVECGALDGERSSNTIVLEFNDKWKGLLVEMDPFFYTQLLAKNRKSSSINACMSPTKFVSYVNYSEDVSGRGQVLFHGLHGESKVFRKVPCFPFHAMLMSLNRNKIDFFSLDVEGLEFEVLKTIPFDKIDITVLSVEYLHVTGGPIEMQSYMESQGYKMYQKIDWEEPLKTLYVHDLVFVQKKYLEEHNLSI